MERQAAAYHEAGHTVIGRVLGLLCGDVTIDSLNPGWSGETIILDPIRVWRRGDGPRRPLAEAYCVAIYAGTAAERIILDGEVDDFDIYHDDDHSDALGDFDRAWSIIRTIGVPGSKYAADDIEIRYEARLRRRSSKLVRLHRDRIELVASDLQERGTLYTEEVDAIISSGLSMFG